MGQVWGAGVILRRFETGEKNQLSSEVDWLGLYLESSGSLLGEEIMKLMALGSEGFFSSSLD